MIVLFGLKREIFAQNEGPACRQSGNGNTHRAGQNYPWGNLFVAENVVYNRSEEQGSADVTHADGNPVRPNGASWVGAIDMSGNVQEWTNTRYDNVDDSKDTMDYQGLFPYPYRADDGREADETLEQVQRNNSIGLHTIRVVRSGSWGFSGPYLLGAARGRSYGDEADFSIGFRCGRSS